jgi:RHS repeat-associated protein
VVMEYDLNGNSIVDYTYGIGLISQHRGSATSFYHADGLGSTRLLTDSSGSVTDTYVYDAYGTLLSSSGTTTNSYLYTGEQYDKNLGEYYLRTRYYNPSEGRFTGRDPFDGMLSEPLSLNKYAYVHGNPVNATDPTGMFALSELNVTLAISTILAGYGVYNANANPLRSSAGTAGSVGGNNAGNSGSSLTWQTKLILSGQAIRSFIITADSTGQTFIPIVFYGKGTSVNLKNPRFEPFPQTTQHILDAIYNGKQFILSAWASEPAGHGENKVWYDEMSECDGYARRVYKRNNNKQTGGCDEYPFFSSEQGGITRYRQRFVSLRLVPAAESDPQGALMDTESKVKRAGVIPGDNDYKWYGVVPIPSLELSFWRKRDGNILL